MKLPNFLPAQLNYCRQIESVEGLFKTLLAHGGEDFILFFEAAASDGTWIAAGGGKFFKKMLQWASAQYLQQKLTLAFAKRIAAAIRENYSQLQEYIIEDVTISCRDGLEKVNALLAGAEVLFFHEIFRHKLYQMQEKQIALTGVDCKYFRFFKQHVYTGNSEGLWKLSPEELVTLIHQAEIVHLKILAKEAGEVFKRYLDKENAAVCLMLALKEQLAPLVEETCRFINSQQDRVKISLLENKLAIHIFAPVGLQLVPLVPWIRQLAIDRNCPATGETAEFVSSCSNLRSLELCDSLEVEDRVWLISDRLEYLNLSRCRWLQDETVGQVLSAAQRLSHLVLEGNPQINFLHWKRNYLRKLNVSYCQLGDDEASLILNSTRELRELDLGFTQITDQTLYLIPRVLPHLETINLQNCQFLTDEGITFLVKNISSLSKINVKNLKISQLVKDMIKKML